MDRRDLIDWLIQWSAGTYSRWMCGPTNRFYTERLSGHPLFGPRSPRVARRWSGSKGRHRQLPGIEKWNCNALVRWIAANEWAIAIRNLVLFTLTSAEDSQSFQQRGVRDFHSFGRAYAEDYGYPAEMKERSENNSHRIFRSSSTSSTFAFSSS